MSLRVPCLQRFEVLRTIFLPMATLVAESARIPRDPDDERLSSSLSSLIDSGAVSLEVSSASALSACQRSSSTTIEASSSVLRSPVASILRSPVASVRSRCRSDFCESEFVLVVVAFVGIFWFNFITFSIVVLLAFTVVLSIL